MSQRVIFSGIQPTGRIHLGNYLGAIRSWVKLQNSPLQAKHVYCIVDYHALTDKYKQDNNIGNEQSLKDDTLQMAATLIAAGIDVTRSTLFIQSAVPQHVELQWILSCIAPQNWLNRMTQYKDKSTKHSTLGLFTYPVLMAADIILYQATDVPVGDDQKQHVELCRDYVVRFNSLFGSKQPLVVPNYMESKSPRVMSLRDSSKKMSKSDVTDYSRINIMDDISIIFDKIRKAKTDSLSGIHYDEQNRPELSNLIKIYSDLGNCSIQQIEKTFHNSTMIQFKDSLSELIAKEIGPIALRTEELLNDRDKLTKILEKGNQNARTQAEINMKQIKSQMGMLTF